MRKNKTSQLPRLFPLLMWLLTIVYYFYVILLQVSPSVMVHELMKDFSVNATALGGLAGLYFYTYASMQLISGVLLDRFGARYILTIAALLCGLGCLLFATAAYFFELEIARILIGASSAVAAVTSMHITARHFRAERFSILVGLMIAAGMLGAVFGLSPLSLFISHFGWRHALLFFSLIGFALAIIHWRVIKDTPAKQPMIEYSAASPRGLIFVLKSKYIWSAALYSGLMYAPAIAFGSLWGVPFLMRAYHFSTTTAALLVSDLYIGFMLGSPIIGWTFEKFNRPFTHLFLGAFLSLISLGSVIYLSHLSQWQVAVLLMCSGFSMSVFMLPFTFVRKFTPLHYNGSALGFTNMMNTIIGATATPLIGVILDFFWRGNLMRGIRNYSLQDYHLGFFMLLLFFIFALLLTPVLRNLEPHKKMF